MRKTLLLLVMALFMPVLAMAQTENKAISKAARSGTDKTETRLLVSSEVLDALKTAPTTSHSLAAWVNISSVPYTGHTQEAGTKHGVIMGYGGTDHANDNGLWNVTIDSNGKLALPGCWGLNGANGMGIAACEICDLPLNEWVYIVTVVDIENMKICVYLNGELVCDKTIINAPNWFTNESPYIYFAGFNFAGALDEVQVYNKALNATEVATAKVNPTNVSGLVAYYTLDEAVSTNEFVNQASGVTAPNAVWQTATFQSLWGNGLVYQQSASTVAPTLAEGREIVPFEVSITAYPAEGGTYTISDGTQTWTIDENFDYEPITVNTGTELTFTAIPEEGYELIGFFTMNGDTPEYINGGKFTPFADAIVGAAFTNQHCALTITNAQEIPYTITLNGTEVTDFSSLMVAAPYQLTLNVPDTKVLNGVTLAGRAIEAVNGVYELFLDEEDAELVIDAREKYQYTITINQPEGATVAVSYGSGTAATTVNSGDKVLEGTTLNVTATPDAGYKVTNITVGDESFAGKEYSFVPADDVTISAITEEGVDYPAMVRYFTNGINQQNRYVKKVTTTGTETPTVFNATTKEELPYTYFEAPNSTKREEGAIIDKTANPIIVNTDVRSFTMTFEAWTDAIDGYATELGWSCQGAFIDWNRDGNFSGTDEIYGDDGGSHSDAHFRDTPYTRTITIPENVGPGTYRLRVVYNEPANGHNATWVNTYFDGTAPIELRNGVAYDFDIVVASSTLESPRTITVVSADEALGTVAITDPATEENSVTTDQKYVTVKATPADGVSFINWTNADNVEVSTQATYKYDGEADVTLKANFGYAVTYSVEGEGRIDVTAGTRTLTSGSAVAPGSNINITVTPGDGYALYALMVNGEKVELTDNAYTCTVNEATVISATFGEARYTISFTTQGNGTVEAWSDLDDNQAPAAGATQYTDGSFIQGDGETELYIYFIPGDNKDNEKETITLIVYEDENENQTLTPGDCEPVTAEEGTPYYGAYVYYAYPTGNTNVSVTFTNETSAISDIIFDAENGPVEYYNIQGVRVAAENLTPGFYIARQGSKTKKILIRK